MKETGRIMKEIDEIKNNDRIFGIGNQKRRKLVLGTRGEQLLILILTKGIRCRVLGETLFPYYKNLTH